MRTISQHVWLVVWFWFGFFIFFFLLTNCVFWHFPFLPWIIMSLKYFHSAGLRRLVQTDIPFAFTAYPIYSVKILKAAVNRGCLCSGTVICPGFWSVGYQNYTHYYYVLFILITAFTISVETLSTIDALLFLIGVLITLKLYFLKIINWKTVICYCTVAISVLNNLSKY